jgi:predicted dehydrogenase
MALSSPRLSRRGFLAGTTATATAAVAAPWIVPSTCFGANERITLGFIGVGGQGRGNLSAFLRKNSLVNVAAICDVDTRHAAEAVKLAEKGGGNCEVYADYRRLLERKEIDAVVVSTPDHWHALPTVHACRAGKDVYCEKPLSLTIAEGRAMVSAARENSRIVQTGSQQRSAENFRKACELVRSGAIGKVREVLVGIAESNFKGPPVADGQPPAELDYNTWIGPAASRPYNEKRVHYNFRFFWDYSGGQMTNWGAHHIDIAHWGLGMDDSGPVSVEGTAGFHPEKWYEVTMSCRLVYTYADGVRMVVGQQQPDIPGGTTFIGEKGRIFVNRGVLKAEPNELLDMPRTVSLDASSDHHGNFLDSIKTRKRPICDVEIGHRTATACHLGNIVARLGRKITWDAKAETITGDAEAAAMLSRTYREPWAL